MHPETNTFKLQAYSMRQLRALYNVGRKTFASWLKNIPDLGAYDGKCYTPAQVDKIIKHLGTP